MSTEKMLEYLMLKDIIDTASLKEIGSVIKYNTLIKKQDSLREEFINDELQNSINKDPLQDSKSSE